MNPELEDYIEYRLARAHEALEEAKVLAGSGHWNACVNRIYYACFYAVSALLSEKKFASSKHSGVRALFNQHFVKTGIISKEMALIYNSLYERRQEGDYEVFTSFHEMDVKPWLMDAGLFVQTVVKVLQKARDENQQTPPTPL